MGGGKEKRGQEQQWKWEGKKGTGKMEGDSWWSK